MVALVARAFLRSTRCDGDWRHRGDAACSSTTSTASDGTIVTSWLVTKPILGWEEAKLQQ